MFVFYLKFFADFLDIVGGFLSFCKRLKKGLYVIRLWIFLSWKLNTLRSQEGWPARSSKKYFLWHFCGPYSKFKWKYRCLHRSSHISNLGLNFFHHLKILEFLLIRLLGLERERGGGGHWNFANAAKKYFPFFFFKLVEKCWCIQSNSNISF